MDDSSSKLLTTATLAVACVGVGWVLGYRASRSSTQQLASGAKQSAKSSTVAKKHKNHIALNAKNGLAELIGNSPLIYLKSLSDVTGCQVYAKAEYLNPGGSTKDRIACRTNRSNRGGTRECTPDV